MIDWDAPDQKPKPEFTPPQNVVEIRTVADALALLEQWQAAYDELRREHARLHAQYIDAQFWAETYRCGEANYEALYRAVLDPENDDIRDRLSSDLLRV